MEWAPQGVRTMLSPNPPYKTFQPNALGTRLKEVTVAWQENQMTNFNLLSR